MLFFSVSEMRGPACGNEWQTIVYFSAVMPLRNLSTLRALTAGQTLTFWLIWTQWKACWQEILPQFHVMLPLVGVLTWGVPTPTLLLAHGHLKTGTSQILGAALWMEMLQPDKYFCWCSWWKGHEAGRWNVSSWVFCWSGRNIFLSWERLGWSQDVMLFPTAGPAKLKKVIQVGKGR